MHLPKTTKNYLSLTVSPTFSFALHIND